jgi:hypothetical protein
LTWAVSTTPTWDTLIGRIIDADLILRASNTGDATTGLWWSLIIPAGIVVPNTLAANAPTVAIGAWYALAGRRNPFHGRADFSTASPSEAISIDSACIGKGSPLIAGIQAIIGRNTGDSSTHRGLARPINTDLSSVTLCIIATWTIAGRTWAAVWNIGGCIPSTLIATDLGWIRTFRFTITLENRAVG